MDTILADVRSGLRMLAAYPTPVAGRGPHARSGHRPQHDGVLGRQRRALQGAAVPGRRPHRRRSSRRTRRSISRGSRSAARTWRCWQERQTSFEKFGAYALRASQSRDRGGTAGAIQRRPADVGAFEALGVQPILGRGFQEGDDRAGRRAGHALGRRPVARSVRQSPDIVGRSIRANGEHADGDRRHAGELRFPDSPGDLDAAGDRSAGETERPGPELSGRWRG